jgi:hypothetical protein
VTAGGQVLREPPRWAAGLAWGRIPAWPWPADPGRGRAVPAGPPPRPAAVDRRFNRGRHDAAQMIEALGGRLRDQVDLTTLTGELLAVVDQTMQPSQASLWLRPSVGAPAGRR